MMKARHCLAVASCCGVLTGFCHEAFADAAASAPVRVHLTTARGPGAQRCVSAEEIEAAVEARLGRSVFDAVEAADLIADVQASKRGRGFVIDVRLFDRNRQPLGQRRLSTRARHCSALDDSLALVLSLAADVTRASLGAPEAKLTPAPAALETALEIPATTLAPREELRVRPALGVVLGMGLLPHASAGVEAGIDLMFPHFWPISLRAALWHDQRLGAESGIDFSVRTLQLGICPATLEAAALEVSFCAEQLFGKVHASGFGFDQADVSDQWLAAFGPGVVLRYWLGRAFVSVRSSLLVPAVQRRYYVQDGERVVLHESAWVFGVASLAAGFEF